MPMPHDLLLLCQAQRLHRAALCEHRVHFFPQAEIKQLPQVQMVRLQ